MNIYRGKSAKQFYLASLLYDSIDDNNLRAVKFLLCEKEADPNIVLPTTGISPFHLAIGGEDVDFAVNVTRLVLQNGGNPNVCSDDDLTPVHIAAAWGRTDILEMLLKFGGDPESRDSNWMTPIHYATKESYPDCLDLLKSYLPSRYDVLYSMEKEDCVQYNLDKVFVNNGYATGEYEVCSKTDSINVNNLIETLPNLPQPDTTKYVLNWFDTHIDDRGGKTFIKDRSISNNLSDEDKPLPYESSLDESENENNKNKDITFRKAYKKKIKIKCRKSMSIEDVEVDKNAVVSSGFDSAESNHKSEAKEVSSESGIVSLPPSKETASKQAGKQINPYNYEAINLKPNYRDQKMLAANSVHNNLNITSNRLEKPSALNLDSNMTENNSDYLTCSSVNSLLNKNIFEIDSNITNDSSDKSCIDNKAVGGVTDESGCTEISFVTVSAVYKYEDKQQGIVLYEKRVHKQPSEANGSVKTLSSKMSSLPETINYDADTLRRELTILGFNPGPITATTMRVHLKKLHQLRKRAPHMHEHRRKIESKRVYSPELEATLKNPSWTTNLAAYKLLEDALVKEFSSPSTTRKWREGNSKSSFAYLLLDPRKTDNLPCRADTMNFKEVWETFLSSIFYVGKGKKNRPFSHLYDAVTHYRQNNPVTPNEKLKTILDIWNNRSGVICLHIFHNIIPVEAYTREAAMIEALRVENVSNMKIGDFYGTASMWKRKEKCMLGTYLLYKAMNIYLQEGERQLSLNDIECG
ncbi:uncharacterized protein LOC114324549 [Diabrotica virgifera virgifera]|uniref:Uncharacterized protein LOC114324549 n=1 Tax=Diabrotica virgifera virgifera TaxID=50390 RepID=A0A6P7EYA2_DIAVI|nr:uncharacterized protein LOC114324549 [Diabrotica virgifera virgifera]